MTTLLPPAPDPGLVVDPRVGARGPALLALEDGTVFRGIAFGADVAAGGDLVVNTSQTGYQEVCTDPSYAGQVVVMTYPLIGNYGRIRSDDQSERPWLRALVVATATAAVVEQASQLAALLRGAGIPAIAGIDTRALARHLRTHGCLRGLVTASGEADAAEGIARARGVARWEDQDFVEAVSPTAPFEVGDAGAEPDAPLVAIVDFGLKANIVRSLRRRGVRVRVLPHTAAPGDVLAPDVAGVVLSPGPGDPARLAGGPRGRGHRRRAAPARDLPRSPAGRAGCRGRDPPPPLRPPRRQSPGPGHGERPGPGDGPEP
jgi:carbamoyl-phosphate synthase small subunit